MDNITYLAHRQHLARLWDSALARRTQKTQSKSTIEKIIVKVNSILQLFLSQDMEDSLCLLVFGRVFLRSWVVFLFGQLIRFLLVALYNRGGAAIRLHWSFVVCNRLLRGVILEGLLCFDHRLRHGNLLWDLLGSYWCCFCPFCRSLYLLFDDFRRPPVEPVIRLLEPTIVSNWRQAFHRPCSSVFVVASRPMRWCVPRFCRTFLEAPTSHVEL